MLKQINSLVIGLILCVVSGSTFASLITNGDFETGDFTGWQTSQAGGSSLFLASNPGDLTLGASPTNDFYAFAGNQGAPSLNVFWQTFTVPTDFTSAVFSFDYAYQNFAGGFVNPNPDTLSFTGASNQQVRVEILLASAAFDSVELSDIVFSALQTNPGDNLISPWANLAVDVTSALSAFSGQDLIVRFAQVDNNAPFDFGFDNVSIVARTASIPEPSTLAITALALLGLGRFRR